MQKLKIGFIGYGRHAKANLYSSFNVLGIKLHAVAVTKEETAAKLKEAHVAPNVYTNYLEMLEKEDLDCVFVCTQPESQIDIVKNCLLANVHVFVEKNLGFNATEAKEILDLSHKQKKEVVVGFMKRFAPTYLMAKNYLEDSEFGKLLSMNQIFTSRSFVKSSAEYMLFAAIHYIDLIRYYMGEIVDVKGFDSSDGKNFCQTFTCLAESGATASLYYAASPAWDIHVEDIYLTGSNGYIVANGLSKLRYHIKEQAPSIPQWQHLSEKEQVFSPMATTGAGGLQSLYLNGFVGEIEGFLQSIENGTKPQNNAEENYKTMQLYDKLVDCIN